MSWWVKNVESFYRPPESAYTSKRATIICDTPQDLPAYNERQSDENDPFILMYGSDADVISNGRKYILNGSNEWIIQPQSGGGGGGSSEAIDINYDNTQSGLSATNVQAAIDELEDEIDSIVPGGDVDAEDVGYNNITSGLTATNVQDAIDEIKDLDDMQDRALAELYGEDANQQLEIDYAINTGAKNLLKITASSGTLNTATIDIADDGSLHITGQPTANGAYVISSGIELIIPENSYILSVGAEAGNTKIALSLRIKGTTQYVDLYYAESRIIPEGTYDRAHIYLYADTVYDTYIYPMIRNSVIRNATFEPYAPTNRELYGTKLSAEDVWGYGQLIPDNADLNNYTTGGKYYGGNSAGNSVLNLPVANGTFSFTLEVKKATPSMTYQYLRVCRLADDPYIYFRRRYNSWGSWYRFAGETVVVSASTQSLNSPMTLNLDRNELNEQLDSNFESLDTNHESLDSTPEEEEGEEDV